MGTVRLSFMLATSLAAGPLMAEAPAGRAAAAAGAAGARAAATAGRRLAGRLRGRGSGAVAVRALADDAALEQAAPLGPDGRGIPEELLVHRLGEPGVGRLEYVRIHDVHHPDEGAHERGRRRRPRTLKWSAGR